MSTIRVDNLQASNGLSPVFRTYGVAKAVGHWNQSGTPSEYESDNVSSWTDTATGRFRMNLINSMATTTYPLLHTAGANRALDGVAVTTFEQEDNAAAGPALNVSAGGTAVDAVDVKVVIYGGLA